MKKVLTVGPSLFVFAVLAQAQTTHPPAFATEQSQRAFLNQYCAYCHNDQTKSGSMSLSKFDLVHITRNGDLPEKMIKKVRVGLMPPPGMPRPKPAVLNAFAASLETAIDREAVLHPDPGRPPLHRLNRTEYANSVRDLLNVDVDVSSLLPADDMSHGFDNMADALAISPALMEGYIRAAGRISREAVGDPAARAITQTYSLPRVANQLRHVEGTPLGTRGGISVVHDFPADGEYVFKLGLYYAATGALYGQNQGKGQMIEVAVNGARAALIEINPSITLAKDGIKTDPIHVKAGPQRISASFVQKFDGPIEDEYHMVEQTLVDTQIGSLPGMTTIPHLHEFSVTGPVKVEGVSDTPSRRKILSCHPAPGADEIPCAKQIISALARQAWRRPVDANDLEALLSFYQSGKNEGGFETGVRTAIQAILANPEFVIRFERVPAGVAPGRNFHISDLELASRLSFFLWSSPPDDQLISLAAENKLRDPITLEKQVKRMLADPRSEALTDNFAVEWLHLQNLKGVNPDLFLFPNFDRTLTDSMRRETQLLFDNVMREDRPVTELLTANYTFVDERLAKHYGIPNIMGNRFRRVPVTDPNRYGLLGHGSILTLTSYAIRTSPVQRGKYVMEVLLGTPPPPAPPNVPALPENADSRTGHAEKFLSVRQRMEEHRSNAACAGCHKMMDPIGFSLENFDAVGVWRTNDSGFRIDPAGQMFDGAKLDGPASLRQAILNHSDAFISTFTENLLAYGLGRVIDASDMPAVRAIDRAVAARNNQFSSFVLAIVKSEPFQYRRAESLTVAQASRPAQGSVEQNTSSNTGPKN
jgi:Protein of unknown function (DUF1592)/Protein of unknown function (DUF1588)/Protein of unknown function (DUF1587)/Protein of unknown function (DUF1585)/Protein of unknown function (DUF1595)